MGDAKAGPVRRSFNPQLRIEFHGATLTSDAGMLLPLELGERLGLSALIEQHLTNPGTGRNFQFPLPDLFRQSIYGRLAGYENLSDAEGLAEYPALRTVSGDSAGVSLNATVGVVNPGNGGGTIPRDRQIDCR